MNDHFLATKSIPGPAGAIEIACASNTETPERIAIICHPHPLFGGSMGNKVVTTLERLFRDLHCVTVRFNFRGVAGSAGSFDHGEGEAEDLRAVYAFARRYFPDLPLDLAGFSFGSFVATRMANTLDAARLIAIAPPVLSWDFSKLDPVMPWWIVQGEQDEVVAASAVYQFAAAHARQPTLLKLPGGHFFHGLLPELRALLQAQLQAP
jgi:uncharacterized protein